MSTNKFLGINSINVLKQYIDEQILLNENSTRLITLQVYKYIGNNEPIDMPIGGSFDSVGGQIIYPTNDWKSLKAVVNSLGQSTETGEINYEEVANKLKVGSIYMSAGITEQGTIFRDWSNPIKISGENGINVQFEYSHNSSGVGRNKYPNGVDSINNKEYVWIKYGDEDWRGPFLWACYAQNGTDMLYRYCVTATNESPALPASDIDGNWMTSAAASVNSDKPYLWMTSKKVPAGMTSSEEQWSTPILFGHYGKDGIDGKDGVDGQNGVDGKDGINGKDGVNGNRLNSIDYTTIDKALEITNFNEANYFISNADTNTNYSLNFGDEFESGYTGKFVNIGTADMIISTVNAKIIGSCTEATEIVIKPQESIELICYNNNESHEFILIGKCLSDSTPEPDEPTDEPTEEPTNPDENTDLEAGLPEIQ